MSKETNMFGDKVDKSKRKIKGYYRPIGAIPDGSYFNHDGVLVRRDKNGNEVAVKKNTHEP